ncbi:MAG: hypothetical protein HC869_07460 [Rhodospirillales bacterium]|nr:hypothetical protein [Rhodospirillales bacterium]
MQPLHTTHAGRVSAAMDVASAGEGLIVVINADAGRVRQLGPRALRTLVRRSGPADLSRVITTDRHDLRQCLVEAARAAPRAIAIMGGDGTAHGALETLTPLGVPAIPLPGGTMNRLAARVFGRAKLEQCVASLEEGGAQSLAGGKSRRPFVLRRGWFRRLDASAVAARTVAQAEEHRGIARAPAHGAAPIR